MASKMAYKVHLYRNGEDKPFEVEPFGNYDDAGAWTEEELRARLMIVRAVITLGGDYHSEALRGPSGIYWKK